MNIRQRFRQSIHCGTGEAFFILRDYPTIDFSKDITKASIKNLAFDGQVEGDRAHYVASLINLSNQKNKIVNNVLRALSTERQNTWALEQLFELAAIFAKEGNQKARQAIYGRYYKKVISGSEWCGEDAILKLDGIEGLKHIAQIKGKDLLKNSDDREDSFLVLHFQKEHPTVKVYRELEKSSKDNPYIKAYLETIRDHKWTRPKRRKRSKYNYRIVKENIENKKTVPIPPLCIKELGVNDIRKLANDFLEETEPEKQEKYLRVFKGTKYPYDYRPILKIAKNRNSRNNRLVEFACKSLRYFRAMDIRQFAIDKLNKTSNPADYLLLLVANYRKGDWKLLRTIADKYRDESIIHSLVWGYIDIYKANKTKECKKPLEILYEKLTCGPHRNEILEILHHNRALSRKILNEMEYDSYEATRELHEKIKARSSVQ